MIASKEMAPVKVYGLPMNRSVARVLACLEEVGAEYEVMAVDLHAAEHKRLPHLARNPFGQVQAFQDGDLIIFDIRQWHAANHLPRPHCPGDLKVLGENLEKLKAIMEIYAEHLSKFNYLAGDFISLADISHFPMVHLLQETPYESVLDTYPHVKAWMAGVMDLPAVKKVMGLMKIFA